MLEQMRGILRLSGVILIRQRAAPRDVDLSGREVSVRCGKGEGPRQRTAQII